jgi:hypothetical protein
MKKMTFKFGIVLSIMTLFMFNANMESSKAQTLDEGPSISEPSRSCVTVQPNKYTKTTSCTGSGEMCEDVSGC